MAKRQRKPPRTVATAPMIPDADWEMPGDQRR